MAAKLKLHGRYNNSVAAHASLSSLSSSSFRPMQLRGVLFKEIKLQRPTIAAMALKRSPKRLMYSPQRFSKDDMLLYIEADPSGLENWKLDPVVKKLKEGAVGVIPTDTVYAMVCDMNNQDAIERLRRLKDIDYSKPLSILCRSFRDIGTYTTGFPCGDSYGHPDIFRAVRRCLPGPYTFILTASKQLPKNCINYGTRRPKYSARKTIGVRMPDDAICKAILENMDGPLISTSVKSPKEDEWILDPGVIADVYRAEGLDFVVDGGLRVAEPSTVVDMTGAIPKIVRQGKERYTRSSPGYFIWLTSPEEERV